ncbi:MAG: dephospho-CoA kinase [Pseudohongiellaceae bacterium]
MFTVGLTGGIGSGKTTIARFFLDQNIEVINADEIARKVVEPGTAALSKIQERFGSEILINEKSLNRALLREKIFKDNNQRIWLESLLHPLIEKEITNLIVVAVSRYVILESPLLFETNQHKLVNRTLVVDVSPQVQLERAISRDGGSEGTIKAIMNSQISRDDRISLADDIIDNEQSFQSVQTQLKKFHQNYLYLANKYV